MNTPRRLLLLSGLLALTAGAQEGTAASWVENLHLTATGTAAWVNNHSRTSSPATRKDSTTYEFSLGGSQPRQLASSLLLVASEELSILRVQEFELADNLRAGGRVALQRKFGLGPLAPVLQVSGGVAYKSARFAGDRGWTTEAGIQLAKRVLPNLRLAAGAQWLEHAARSNVFDLVQHSFSVDASWDINDRWSLGGSVSRLEGDIVANAAWPVWAQAIGGGFGATVKNYYTSRPWTETHIYGPRWVSYNVEADVDLWSVSLSYRVSDHTALELRQSAAFVINRIGVRYPTDTVGLSLNHRF
jgi:hypothetical protein